MWTLYVKRVIMFVVLAGSFVGCGEKTGTGEYAKLGLPEVVLSTLTTMKSDAVVFWCRSDGRFGRGWRIRGKMKGTLKDFADSLWQSGGEPLWSRSTVRDAEVEVIGVSDDHRFQLRIPPNGTYERMAIKTPRLTFRIYASPTNGEFVLHAYPYDPEP
jgi:hypothetical protein